MGPDIDAVIAVVGNAPLLCKAIDPYDDLVHVLVLKVGPGLTLRHNGAEQDFAAEKVGEHWIITFTTAEHYGELPKLPAGKLTLQANGARIGEDAEVFTSLPFLVGLRDWAWAWTPTVGPAELRVLVNADEAAIDAWFLSHASRYYTYDKTDPH